MLRLVLIERTGLHTVFECIRRGAAVTRRVVGQYTAQHPPTPEEVESIRTAPEEPTP